MARLKKNYKKVMIFWSDAIKYSGSSSDNESLVPIGMCTRGILIQESPDGMVIKDPYSVYQKNGRRSKKEIKKKPTFLFIPHGMIQRVEYVKK